MNRPIRQSLSLILTLIAASAASAQSERSEMQRRVDRLAEQIHLRYQHHTPSLDKRRDAVAGVLAEWNRASTAQGVPANRERMMAWLDRAMLAAMPGGSGVMPPLPAFEASSPATAATAPAETPLPANIKAETPAVVSADATHAIEPVGAVPSDVATMPEATRSGSSPEPPAASLRSQFAAPRAVVQRSAAKPITPPEAAATPSPAPAPRRSKWSRNPSAAPLEWRDPFVDDPTASPNPLRSGARRETRKPVVRSARRARIDRRQLAADIRGYNTALRELQASLLDVQDDDILGLVEAVEELSRLEERREFLEMYRAGLSASEQASLPRSPSVELVRELLLRKATATAQREAPSQQKEVEALEQLKERLAQISGLDSAAY